MLLVLWGSADHPVADDFRQPPISQQVKELAADLSIHPGMTGGGVLSGIVGVALTLTTASAALAQQPAAPAQEQTVAPRFRSSVDVVSVAAVVRDRKGRFVTDLLKKDFEVVEAGQPRAIVDFRAEVNGPVKLAVLMDVSGSMRMAQRTADARRAAEHIFANLVKADEAAVFSFDTMLAE